MLAILLASMLTLTVHVDQSVEDMTLVIVDRTGAVVERQAAPTPGDYVFDDLADGSYTVRAMVDETVVASIANVNVPLTESVEISVSPESVARSEVAQDTPADQGARRNQNIQVNLVDNRALSESLGRQGAQVSPITEFSAVRGNYAAEIGGIGRDPSVIRADRQNAYHGEIYETHNNNKLNARAFFQVGKVLPSRRNQYGFRFGGPLGSDTLSFVLTGEETRESGFVNGNVLVPLPNERAALAEDPDVKAFIQGWLDAYPNEAPNRPEIAANLLNTNTVQTVRNTGGTFRLDWEPHDTRNLSLRYTFNDNFIDSFEFVVGQNPNQSLRPQTLNLAWTEQLSSRTTLQFGVNYTRGRVDVLVPPGAVGPFVNFGRDFEALGPGQQFPINKASNDFQYLTQASTNTGAHQLDWGIQVIRSQINEFQSDGKRGNMNFGNNFGRSSIENFRLGTPSRYSIVIGEVYRGFRRWDVNGYLNDRLRLAPGLDLTLGLRYEFAGAPSEVNDLTTFPYSADTNNIAPRIGIAYSTGAWVARAGYGIAYGDVFPATSRIARLNPPDVIRIDIRSPDVLDPLKDFVQVPGEVPRSSLNVLDSDLVAPYMHQYTLQIERELPENFRIKASYVGSRNLKLFHVARENRAARVEGIPLTTSTINLRRPDQSIFGIRRMTNAGRAYFDAGQLSVDKVFSQGLALRATYTFSKALDLGTDFSNTGTGRDERRTQIEALYFEDLKTLSRFDAPHAFVLGYSYQFPSRLGGFTLSGTTILKDGTPFSVETGTDAPPFGNVDGERNDRPTLLDPSILGTSFDDPDTAQSILVVEAFDREAAFRDGRGTLRRGSFRKDGTTNFNVAISRDFPDLGRSDTGSDFPDGIHQRPQPSAVRPAEHEPFFLFVRSGDKHGECGADCSVHASFQFLSETQVASSNAPWSVPGTTRF